MNPPFKFAVWGGIPRRIALVLSLGLVSTSGISGWALGESAQITGLTVRETGDLVFQVSGEGFDPLVSLQNGPNGQYRIVIRGEGVGLAVENVLLSQWDEEVSRKVPAVAHIQRLSTAHGFQWTFISWQKLQPQILSNTGAEIVLSLRGPHELPPAVAARQRREAVIALMRKAAQSTQTPVTPAAYRLIQTPPLQTTTSKALLPTQPSVSVRPQDKLGNLRALTLDEEAFKPLASPKKVVSSAVIAASPKEDTLAMMQLAQPFAPEKLAAQQNALKPNDSAQASHSDAPAKLIPVNDTAPLPGGAIRLTPTPAHYSPDDPQNTEPAPLPQQAKPIGPLIPAIPPIDTLTAAQAPVAPALPQTGPAVQSFYVLARNRDTPKAIRQALQALETGNFAQAESGLQDYVTLHPGDLNARFLLAKVWLAPEALVSPAMQKAVDTAQRRNDARRELREIIAQTPYLPAYKALIDLEIAEKDYLEANRLMEAMSRLAPQEAQVLAQQGKMDEALNEPMAAQQAYRQALESQPDNVDLHYRLALTDVRGNRFEAARWEILQALAAAPDDERLWKLLGLIAEKRNEPDQALRFYREAIQASLLMDYGKLQARQNQSAQALALYRVVEDLAGDDADLLYNLALLYEALQEHTRAAAVLTRFLALTPPQDAQQPDTRVFKAQALLKALGQPTALSTAPPK